MKPDLEAGYLRHCADFCRRMAAQHEAAMKRAAEAGDVEAWTFAERERNSYLAELERLGLPETKFREAENSPPDRLPESPPDTETAP